MDTVFAKLGAWLQRQLADIVCSGLTNILTMMQEHTTGMTDKLAMDPETYNSEMWGMLQNVINSAIVPIAMLILTAVMCMELVGWLNDSNNMRTSGDIVAQLFKYIIKMGIAVMLVLKAHLLTLGIFQIANYVTTMAISEANTNVMLGLLGSMEETRAALELLNIGELIGMLLIVGIAMLGMFIIQAAVQIIVLGRVIQIYMYCSVGSIPYATLMQKELSGIGFNYIKSLFALAFQGFFMVIAVTMYSYLVSAIDISSLTGGLGSFWGITKFCVELVCCAGALVFTLVGTKSLSKSIFSAH